jgi:hypothetical protein
MDIENLIYKNSVILQDDLTEYMTIFDSEILELYTESWQYNRVLNLEKIREIQNCIRNKHILDTVIHIVYNKYNDKMIVFDGNHRREALILLNKTESKCIKVCCYVYIINTQFVDKFIVERFNIINQMTPIPDIYYDIVQNLDNNSNIIKKKDIIEEVFIDYKKKYSKFFSIHSKCRKPNFNDTIFKDLCNNLSFVTKDELIDKLDKMNNNKKDDLINKTSFIQNKCKAYNFYIFS